jgi:uncharacterized membrane protein
VPNEVHRRGPAALWHHDHPPVRNVNEVMRERMSLGQRVADRVATAVGSWPFIIVQSMLLFAWIVLNVWLLAMVHAHPGFLRAWDPYPFILLNLMLSFQAAYTGPVVMMSQNRQAEKDRLMAQNDFEVNEKAEREIEVVMDHLVHQDQLILDATSRIEALRQDPAVGALAQQVAEILQRVESNDRRILAVMQKLGAEE